MNSNSKWKVRDVAKIALVMALYIVLTITLSPISFGGIQFRISEILIFLCFYNQKYNWAIILGCAISNLFSPLGLVDIGFGTLATVMCVYVIHLFPNPFVGSVYAAIVNGLLVGMELSVFYQLPFAVTFAQVCFGEFVVLFFVGSPFFMLSTRNKRFLALLKK